MPRTVYYYTCDCSGEIFILFVVLCVLTEVLRIDGINVAQFNQLL